ncbi:YceH family protein [Pseudoalteromonas sp. ASV78]|uniref:YceH family protein n=1 Tax=Pseudoalteromonas sp. ASV78 TaxID=3397851 RepID=UPI0039FB8A80
MQLTAIEQRVIGCLLEKQSTTPEHYPLSLNALTNACNQKSNRDPVLTLSETQVQEALDALLAQRLVTQDEGLSGRVTKFAHRFCNTEFGNLHLTEQQRAIICLMLLRGPQTPGELRTRSNRLAEFNNVTEVESALNALINAEHVIKHPREPGKRESRYSHLFADPQSAVTVAVEPPELAALKTVEFNELLTEIDQLKAELQKIKQHLGL